MCFSSCAGQRWVTVNVWYGVQGVAMDCLGEEVIENGTRRVAFLKRRGDSTQSEIYKSDTRRGAKLKRQ